MKTIILLFALIISAASVNAQKITYSEVDREDQREMNFEIIGKVGGNVQIYKDFRNKHSLCIYSPDMVQKNKIDLQFLPDRVINTDFVAYPDFSYMIYQYHKKGILHCTLAKFNADGKLVTEPTDLDTTEISSFSNESKIYSVINSDDKKKIMVFKIKKQHDKAYQMTTMLYNNQFTLLKKSQFIMQINDRDGIFTDFLLDNDGDMVFGRCARVGGREYINEVNLIFKAAEDDKIVQIPVDLKDKTLDEVKLKFDNFNKRIILTSLYYKQRKGNIDGLYTMVWDKLNRSKANESSFLFNDSLRVDARMDNASLRTAFNDHFIRQVIPAQDGSYAIATELYFSSSRGSTWNRYDYLYGYNMFSPYNYYGFYSPFNRFGYYGLYDPFNRFNQNNIVRYTTGNVMVFYFDKEGKLMWSNTIRKEQYDDNTDSFISYQLFNTGSELRFLFNLREKRDVLLNSATIDGNGTLKRQPTLKNLMRDYEFMPKYGKQIGLRQIILPCLYKNYISFANVEF